jgi:hypothetical protein
MNPKIHKKIEKLYEEAKVARLYTDVDESNHLSDGYIHGLTDKFALMSLIGDGVKFDSFCVIRLDDIEDAKESPRHDFYERVFRQRGEMPNPPALDLFSMQTIIKSFKVKSSIPFLVVHIRNDTDVCWIGQVSECTEDAVTLIEVDCNGIYTDNNTYPLADITHITFDGPYEEALWMVNQYSDGIKEQEGARK